MSRRPLCLSTLSRTGSSLVPGHLGCGESQPSRDPVASDNPPHLSTLATQGVRFMETRTVSPMRLPAGEFTHGSKSQNHGLRVNQSSVELNPARWPCSFEQRISKRRIHLTTGRLARHRHHKGLIHRCPSEWFPTSDSATVKQAIQWVDALPPHPLFAWIHLSAH